MPFESALWNIFLKMKETPNHLIMPVGDWLYDGDRCHPGDAGHGAIAQTLLKFMFI